jgi:hypothetical protein
VRCLVRRRNGLAEQSSSSSSSSWGVDQMNGGKPWQAPVLAWFLA